ALGDELRALRIGQAQAATVVAWRLLGGLLLAANGLQLLRRAPAVVGAAGLEQPSGLRGVELRAVALAVGSEWSDVLALGHLRPLIPGDAQPVQVVDDVALEVRRSACQIGVLD